jgi:hypothetical protein
VRVLLFVRRLRFVHRLSRDNQTRNLCVCFGADNIPGFELQAGSIRTARDDIGCVRFTDARQCHQSSLAGRVQIDRQGPWCTLADRDDRRRFGDWHGLLRFNCFFVFCRSRLLFWPQVHDRFVFNLYGYVGRLRRRRLARGIYASSIFLRIYRRLARQLSNVGGELLDHLRPEFLAKSRHSPAVGATSDNLNQFVVGKLLSFGGAHIAELKISAEHGRSWTNKCMPRRMIQFAKQLVLMGALASHVFAFAGSISGAVVNKTKGKPSAGDQVALIDVSAGTREVARTKSDALGHFRFNASQQSTSHLIRVIHGGVRYDSVVLSKDEPVEVIVFDSTRAIANLKTNVQAMRIQTGSGYLRITEILTLVNNSSPPRTVHKRGLFWLAFPQGANLLSSAAQAPQQEAVESIAIPAPSEGRCYFDLPLVPGVTKIQVRYQVSYSGISTFIPHIPFPTESFGVVLPAETKFESSEEGTYIKDSDQYGDLAEVMHDVAAGNAPGFTISSAMTSVADVRGDQAVSVALPAGLQEKRDNVPATSRDSFGAHQLLWTAVSVCGALFVVAARVHRRRSQRPRPSRQIEASVPNDSIRGELFSLELARVQNRISKARYTASRAVLVKRLGVLLGKPDQV